MRIAIHCSYYGAPWNEGVKNMVSRIVAGLEAAGHQAFVLPRILTGDEPTAMEVGDSLVSGFAHAGAIAREHGVDVIHSIQAITSLTGVRTALLRSFGRVPVLLHVTGLGRVQTGYRFGARAAATLVGSPYLLRYYPEARVMYAVPGLLDLSPLEPPNATVPVVGFLGAFERVRGVEDLLSASRCLLDRGVRHTLRMAWNGVGGESGYRRITERARELNLDITIEGTVDLREFYQSTRVVVIPRRAVQRMALPLRIVECALLERPIVVSRILDMEKAVGQMGRSFAVGEPESMADAIEAILRDDDIYNQCITAARGRRDEFLPESTIERLLTEYRQLCS